MARGLSLKVKVVLSLLPALVLMGVGALAQQDVLEKKVTVDFLNVRFSDALRELEKQSHVHFIYSSNIVEPGRRISYTGTNTPLGEVFTRLGSEMNLEFKTQNLYVIIKKGAIIPSPPTLTIPVAPAVTEVSKTEHVRPSQMTTGTTSVDLSARIHREYLRKLDSLNLRNTMLQVNNNMGRKSARGNFFAAAGFYVNDFSGGIELQAGIRSIYGVFNSGLAEGKYLRTGFGVGTNIHLFRKLSVSPVYTFASLKQITSSGIATISEGGYKINAQQHQLKLMFQYPFAKNFYAKAGPTFNLMTLDFTEQPEITSNFTGRGTPRSYSGPAQGNNVSFGGTPIRTSVSDPDDRFKTITSWVGFEAGIFYSLNFSKNR